MNDAEKKKLEELLKETAPLASRLTGPNKVPESVLAAMRNQSGAQEQPVWVKKPTEPERKPSWFEVWRWWLGLATATAALVLIVKLNQPTPIDNQPAIIQVAMLDSIGTTRGTNANPLTVIQQQWKGVRPVEFSDNEKLKQWQQDWGAGSNRTVAKIVYDRDRQELKIVVRKNGKTIEKLIPVKSEGDLPMVIKEAKTFIAQQPPL